MTIFRSAKRITGTVALPSMMSSLYGDDSCAKPEDACVRTYTHTHTHTQTCEHTCTHVRVHSLCSPQIQNLVKVAAGCGMSHKIPKIQNIQYKVLHVFHIKYSNAMPNTLYTAHDNLMVN